MAKNMELSFLFDFYGDMLTDKQRDVIELYYNDDLSLSEIAENAGITRQGVRDSIKRAEYQLLEMEERLGLAKRFRDMQEQMSHIVNMAQEIRDYNNYLSHSREIEDCASQIENAARKLLEE
ncbi:MAG: YlxM family DNA-binding protein [Clostridia bacterium]|nr:YlxM family DNA-binding protein [Clostridia bacterium]